MFGFLRRMRLRLKTSATSTSTSITTATESCEEYNQQKYVPPKDDDLDFGQEVVRAIQELGAGWHKLGKKIGYIELTAEQHRCMTKFIFGSEPHGVLWHGREPIRRFAMPLTGEAVEIRIGSCFRVVAVDNRTTEIVVFQDRGAVPPMTTDVRRQPPTRPQSSRTNPARDAANAESVLAAYRRYFG